MSTLRERIVTCAVEMTTDVGWARVTMGRLAEAAGVSRQTVYNEIGTKDALAEAMILAELERFLRAVDGAFERHPGDISAAIEAAAYDVLVLAQDNALLKAVVSATHGADTELLPLLTTHAESLLAAAKFVVAGRVEAYDVGLDEEHLAAALDMVVRVVLSHVMQPSDSPDRTADDLAWIAARVLGGGG
jgi:AcrR family transcriptional regulator